MTHYQEITLMPCDEVGLYFLWEKVYTQLHLGFVEHKDEQQNVPVGVSFPEYHQRGLGKKIRLFGSENHLQSFDAKERLSRLEDYVHIKTIKQIPQKVNYYTSFQRFRIKMNSQTLIKRHAKRHNLSIEAATKKYEGFEPDKTNLPYIELTSLSKGNRFKLFIKTVTSKEITHNGFGRYGLSKNNKPTSIPMF